MFYVAWVVALDLRIILDLQCTWAKGYYATLQGFNVLNTL